MSARAVMAVYAPATVRRAAQSVAAAVVNAAALAPDVHVETTVRVVAVQHAVARIHPVPVEAAARVPHIARMAAILHAAAVLHNAHAGRAVRAGHTAAKVVHRAGEHNLYLVTVKASHAIAPPIVPMAAIRATVVRLACAEARRAAAHRFALPVHRRAEVRAPSVAAKGASASASITVPMVEARHAARHVRVAVVAEEEATRSRQSWMCGRMRDPCMLHSGMKAGLRSPA